MYVTRLKCHHCDTAIEGRFSLGRLYELSSDQLDFVELFVRSEGKLNRVGQELELSYPAVRARLTDVIRALGYEVDEPEPASTEPITEAERRAVLARVSSGELSADQAIEQLRGKSG
jgi:hypothetical protein